MPSPEADITSNYNRMTLGDLETLWPYVSWCRCLLSIRVDLATDLFPTTNITLLYSTGSECHLTSILVAVPAVVVLSPYDL